jgi:hypothetical protein
MASTPPKALIDSGDITGGAESRGGLLNEDIRGDTSTLGPATGSRERGPQSADSSKNIASWINPTIRGLCKELEAPAATTHILAGVKTILTLPSSI